MKKLGHTPIPNDFFELVPILNKSSLKVLIIILRQTYGWYDSKRKKRKSRDWISVQFFAKRTGLTRKSVSQALTLLIAHNYITATNRNGKILTTIKDRQSSKRIYYSYRGLSQRASIREDYISEHGMSRINHTTKETQTKKKSGENQIEIRKQTDAERIAEILSRRKR